MNNIFLKASVDAINLHGNSYTFTSVSAGVYNIETGKTTNTSTNYTVAMYKKHLKANQYNYPNLIGKDAALFYLANNSLLFAPKPNDKIVDGSSTYIVDAVYEHRAKNAIVLFKILAVKA